MAQLVQALVVMILVSGSACVLSFQIDDCWCSSETVNDANPGLLQKLDAILRTTFFRIFKVNLRVPCLYWDGGNLCLSPGCSLNSEDEIEVPLVWKEVDAQLDKTLPKFGSWTEEDDNWIVQDDSGDDMEYVDLVRNAEGYTGYNGPRAARVWMAMYGENCFRETEKMCSEDRLFYRLVSAIQGSTTAHIAINYPLDEEDLTQEWGPNIEFFMKALGNHPDRIRNVYFGYVFMLRALNKASSALSSYSYETGNQKEDAKTAQMMDDLLSASIVTKCSTENSFDETRLFKDEKGSYMMKQFRTNFRNLSRIMDCVDCEKCKAHGKVAVLGVGTALSIMFYNEFSFNRNEIIALINTLGKFSHAIQIIEQLLQASKRRGMIVFYVSTIALICTTLLLCIPTLRCLFRGHHKRTVETMCLRSRRKKVE